MQWKEKEQEWRSYLTENCKIELHLEVQNAFELCWEKETPRLDSALLTKPFHRPLLLCNLNSCSEVLHRKLVLEQLQAEKAPPCLWTASVSSTAWYRGWRALQKVWKTFPSMRPELCFVDSPQLALWGELKQNFSDWSGKCWWIGKGHIICQDKSHQHRPAQSCSAWVCHKEEPSLTNHIFVGMLHKGFHNL